MSKQNIIQGTVAPGFESVKQLFEDQMHTMAERQAQLCVYHRGERVVDLWADKIGVSNFSADSVRFQTTSLSNTYSPCSLPATAIMRPKACACDSAKPPAAEIFSCRRSLAA